MIFSLSVAASVSPVRSDFSVDSDSGISEGSDSVTASVSEAMPKNSSFGDGASGVAASVVTLAESVSVFVAVSAFWLVAEQPVSAPSTSRTVRSRARSRLRFMVIPLSFVW